MSEELEFSQGSIIPLEKDCAEHAHDSTGQEDGLHDEGHE